MTAVGVNFNDQLFPPNAMKWDPNRWGTDHYDEEEKVIPSQKDAFLWGAGKHPCAGRQHALLGLKMVPVMLFREFDLRISEDSEFLFVRRRKQKAH